MIRGFDIDYIIYKTSMYEDKILNISQFGRDRIYMIKHKDIENNRQMGLFLQKTSKELNILAYRSMYKEMVEDKSFRNLENQKVFAL